jgi:hypothetical protein
MFSSQQEWVPKDGVYWADVGEFGLVSGSRLPNRHYYDLQNMMKKVDNNELDPIDQLFKIQGKPSGKPLPINKK